MFHIQRLEQKHLAEALKLCRENGWNQTHDDWMRILRYQPDGCFAAISDEKLVGTVTSTLYGNQLAWIGMMLVRSQYRRLGIGQSLLETCIEFLKQQSIKTIRLDATPLGYTLYKKLGFQPEYQLRRWHRKAHEVSKESQPLSDGVITRVRDRFLDRHLTLDQRAFGCDRKEWLNQVINDSHYISAANGFGMIRGGYLADYLGPVCASDQGTAQRIVHSLIDLTQRDIFWDILSENETAESLAESFGFNAVRDLTRMYRGEPLSVAQPNILYGLVDPAVG